MRNFGETINFLSNLVKVFSPLLNRKSGKFKEDFTSGKVNKIIMVTKGRSPSQHEGKVNAKLQVQRIISTVI